jgi:thioredoxin reductase
MAEGVDLAIVGGGPAGLAAAAAFRRLGAGSVAVLEREAEAGGIPRHCGHSPFGMREFRRVLPGPAYARRLLAAALAAGATVRTATAVVAVHPGGALDLATPDGTARLAARRVLLATGAREAPRPARLIGGGRPLGVLTTGALQTMVHLARALPFRRPVVVGTELVSFSALLTCRGAGIRPAAMIEEEGRPTHWRASLGLPRLLGVPVLLATRLAAIHGTERVEAVTVVGPAGERRIDCDGVLLTGRFTPESTLVRMSHLGLDPKTGGPVVDQHGRTTDPAVFVAGNLLRPLETAGRCWREGCRVAAAIAGDLSGALPAPARRIAVTALDPVRYAVPQLLALPAAAPALQLRVARQVRGRLELRGRGGTLWSRRIDALPERRIAVSLDPALLEAAGEDITVSISEDRATKVASARRPARPPHHLKEGGIET